MELRSIYPTILSWLTGLAESFAKTNEVLSLLNCHSILHRLEFSSEQWIELTTRFEHRFKGLVGTIESLKSLCANFGLKRIVNLGSSKWLLS